ncbi:MAG TPA: polysaccharide ABC transporter ATP-binding protein [Candidatus Acidoferrum sp.]|nr:polysaccharide ABC transporter ATP-binding protein [Candidatus Acidoferrum sp.]
MTTVIEAVGLGKRYRRGVRVDAGIRHALERLVRSPWKTVRPLFGGKGAGRETFWALKDVSLEVKEGEVLGLIGRNGAGKTTLLKILSRITRPTEGWAEIRGRVRSLLEVGTGFHPELTGRENAYLSGAILGMSKREIDRKFDEIVAFAEIEKFIETPVKHYSTGMYMRLAFAVAAHLEPEILLVDEVLAVGDINFQKKCLGKMGEVAKAGRTVVLVSHQLNQIRRLCQRVVWVDGGQVRMVGGTHEIVSAYESAMARGDENRHGKKQGQNLTKGRFIRWEVVEPRGNTSNIVCGLGPVTIKFVVEVTEPIRAGHHGCALFNQQRELIWAWATNDVELGIGRHELRYRFPMLPIRPGPYCWQVSLYEEGDELDAWECVPEMTVATPGYQHAQDEWNGVLNMPSQFHVSSGR